MRISLIQDSEADDAVEDARCYFLVATRRYDENTPKSSGDIEIEVEDACEDAEERNARQGCASVRNSEMRILVFFVIGDCSWTGRVVLHILKCSDTP